MTFQSEIVDHLFRQQSGKMTAILTRIFGFQNADLIEDVVQESFLKALKLWPVKGMPENPEAWLMTVAKNSVINELNKNKRNRNKTFEYISKDVIDELEDLFLEHEIKDSQLRVLFACCHPSLSSKSQVMLTLRILSGFGDREIANALLMNEEAVKKSIYRAKKELSKYELSIPFLNDVKERYPIVLTIIYLIFNEGYRVSSKNQVYDEDLCYEAIRLASMLLEFDQIDQGEVYALLALMYFSLARFPARVNEMDEMIGIEMQDRKKWDRELLHTGFYCIKKSRQSNRLSRFHLESSIAAFHCSAATYAETNWKQIVRCYEHLLEMEQGFSIKLNHAIAKAKLEGGEMGLSLLKELEADTPIKKRYLLYAAYAEMHFQTKEYELAKSYYKVAIDQSGNLHDKHYLENKLAKVELKLATLPN